MIGSGFWVDFAVAKLQRFTEFCEISSNCLQIGPVRGALDAHNPMSGSFSTRVDMHPSLKARSANPLDTVTLSNISGSWFETAFSLCNAKFQ